MEIVTIEKDAPNLPAHIAVAEGKTMAEGVEGIRAAFNRKGVSLVVWNGAAGLISDGHKAEIAAFVASSPQSANGIDGRAGTRIARAFNALSAQPNAPVDAIAAWRETSVDFLRKLNSRRHGGATVTSAELRMLGLPQTSDLHPDPVGDGTLATFLRTVHGPATLFAEQKDVVVPNPEEEPFEWALRPGAARLWTMRPWAIALLAAPSSEDGAPHAVPSSALLGLPAGTRRGFETMGIKTKKPLFPAQGP